MYFTLIRFALFSSVLLSIVVHGNSVFWLLVLMVIREQLIWKQMESYLKWYLVFQCWAAMESNWRQWSHPGNSSDESFKRVKMAKRREVNPSFSFRPSPICVGFEKLSSLLQILAKKKAIEELIKAACVEKDHLASFPSFRQYGRNGKRIVILLLAAYRIMSFLILEISINLWFKDVIRWIFFIMSINDDIYLNRNRNRNWLFV